MYETHFGLLRRPFLATPDPDCFVPCEAAENALAGLRLCIEGGKGFGILSAPAGAGKTLLCRKLIIDLRDRFATVFLASSNFPTRRSLLQAILYELGHPYMRMAEQELRLELKTAATKTRPDKEAVLVVVDEAHLLGRQLLEELRTTADIDQDGTPLIHVVLSGQLELEEKLIEPGMEALNQRIGCQVMLESLTREESAMYVAHRLRWAGADVDDVIRPDALSIICSVADGLPRCLNQLCDHSLLLAYVADERPVSEQTVREALEDLKQLPLHWNEPAPVFSPLEQLRTEAAANAAAHAEPDSGLETDAADSVPVLDEFPGDDTVEISAANAVVGENVIEVGEGVIEVGEGVIEVGATSSVEVGTSVAVESVEPAETTEPVPAVLEVGATDSVEQESTVPAQDVFETETTIDVSESKPEPIEATVERTVYDSAAMLPSAPSMPAATVRSPSIQEDTSSFEEEIVVDRYARLDAGLPIVSPSAATVVKNEATTSLQEPQQDVALQAAEPWLQGVVGDREIEAESMKLGCDSSAAQTPEQLLDVIEPLISQVLNDGRAWDVESAATVSETVVGPPLTRDEAEWAGMEPVVQESEGLVDQVGDDVPAVAERPMEYDVVQPDASVVPGNAQFPAEEGEAAERKPQGRYALLFSKLRRLQQRRTA